MSVKELSLCARSSRPVGTLSEVTHANAGPDTFWEYQGIPSHAEVIL